MRNQNSTREEKWIQDITQSCEVQRPGTRSDTHEQVIKYNTKATNILCRETSIKNTGSNYLQVLDVFINHQNLKKGPNKFTYHLAAEKLLNSENFEPNSSKNKKRMKDT